MNDLVSNRVAMPVWMTTGWTVVCQKDQERGSAVNNHRPISCLPLTLTSEDMENISVFF